MTDRQIRLTGRFMSAREGWHWISPDGTWHYFIGLTALCGKWGNFDRRTLRLGTPQSGACLDCEAQLADRRQMKGATA